MDIVEKIREAHRMAQKSPIMKVGYPLFNVSTINREALRDLGWLEPDLNTRTGEFKRIEGILTSPILREDVNASTRGRTSAFDWVVNAIFLAQRYAKDMNIGVRHLPDAYAHCGLDNYKLHSGDKRYEGQQVAYRVLIEKSLESPGMYLHGPPGVGKTHLIAAHFQVLLDHAVQDTVLRSLSLTGLFEEISHLVGPCQFAVTAANELEREITNLSNQLPAGYALILPQTGSYWERRLNFRIGRKRCYTQFQDGEISILTEEGDTLTGEEKSHLLENEDYQAAERILRIAHTYASQITSLRESYASTREQIRDLVQSEYDQALANHPHTLDMQTFCVFTDIYNLSKEMDGKAGIEAFVSHPYVFLDEIKHSGDSDTLRFAMDIVQAIYQRHKKGQVRFFTTSNVSPQELFGDGVVHRIAGEDAVPEARATLSRLNEMTYVVPCDGDDYRNKDRGLGALGAMLD